MKQLKFKLNMMLQDRGTAMTPYRPEMTEEEMQSTTM
jgi:hypothetical protein